MTGASIPMAGSVQSQLQWLMDRAQLSELLHSFASALDTKDWQAYADNYADGGYIELPDPQSTTGGTFLLRKEHMLEMVPKSLGRYTATHHISANHHIVIDGDTARSRSYLQAVHVSAQPTDHWSAGGWYDSNYLRTGSGWKFVRVRLIPVWLSGQIKAVNPARE